MFATRRSATIQQSRARVPAARRSFQQAVVQTLESRQLLSTSWQNVNIGGGGFVTGLASSTTGSAIYARTDVGGAYRWDSAGSRWQPITESMPNDANNNGPTFGIGSLAVDPADPNRVFVAAGKYDWSNPSGLYVSTNTNTAAPTWAVIDSAIRLTGNGSLRSTGERLAVDPNNSNVVYYGTNNITGGGVGLRKYVYGTSWTGSTLSTPAVGDTGLGINFVAVDKNGGTVSDGTRTVSKYLYIGVYSATAGNGGVYASADGGASWTKITGLAADKPYRGEVAADGTLYVTYDGAFNASGGVIKVARGSTTSTGIAPVSNITYNGLAVDPNDAATVMVSEYVGSNRIWRSTNAGSSWVLVNRNQVAAEPDGTPSVTRGTALDHVADLMINPANSDEVWASDFLGVIRTQDIKDDTTASTWRSLQRNLEEVVGLALQSAPSGAPLLSGVADVNGFVHNNPDVRPTWTDRFESPAYISTTSIDSAESTSGSDTVYARVGDIFYTTYTDADRTGGVSINGGRDWANFGQLDAHPVTNSSTAGWETWDVGPYLQQQKAAGVNLVTLVLRSSSSSTNQAFLRFSSREGTNAPELLIDGTTTLTATADAFAYKGAQTTNYGNSTQLQAQNYYNQNSFTRTTFLKFDLSSVGSITSAKLRLYRIAAADTNSFPTSISSTPNTGWVEGDGGTDGTPTNEITWANMPTDLYAPPAGAQGGRIAIAANNPANFVWAAENGAVYYSKDRGVTWARGKVGAANLALDAVTQFQPDRVALSSDRVAANTFYAYSKAGSGTIYRSTDGGATWASLTTGAGSAVQYKIEAPPGINGQPWVIAQNYNVAWTFKYWNGSAMVNVPGISGAVDFAFGKEAPGRTNPTVFVRKSNGTFWYSVDATAGSTFTWVQMNVPSINDRPHVMEGDRQTFGRLYVGTDGRGIYYVDANSTFTWDGDAAGTGTSWNTSANWNPDGVPTSWSTAVFGDTGITSGKVISLDANQTVNQLRITTATGFTLGSGTTYGLSFADLERQDVAGTEANQTIAAPVNLTADSNWTVNGSNALSSTGGIAGAFGLTKLGAGQLNLGANTYSGNTTVSAGLLRATANGAIKGNLIVGDGIATVSFTSASGVTDAIANAKNVTVNANGTVSFGAGSENINALTVNGGTFNTNYSYVNGNITMTGGSIGGSGAIYGNHATITTNASPTMALFSTGNSLYGYATSTFSIADGAAPVDLKVTGSLSGGATANNLVKSGAGLLWLGAANSQVNPTFSIGNGTVLVNNTTGSGTGRSAVTVAASGANATLGGVGTIGGVAGYTNANVTLSGSGAYIATLAPGSVNETTGADILGTLTVGSAGQANNVTFNGNSRLAIGMAGDSADRLSVNGNLTIAAGTSLVFSASGTQTLPSYTIATCTGTLSGTFATVTGVPAGYEVVYGANSITLEQSSSSMVQQAGPVSQVSATARSSGMRILAGRYFLSELQSESVSLFGSQQPIVL